MPAFSIFLESHFPNVPSKQVDPIVTASAIIMNLQSIISRNVSPLEAGVVSITKFEAGDAFNVIPASALLRGTIRSLSTEKLLALRDRVQHIIESTAATYGCNVTLTYSPDFYPPTVNNPELFETFSRDVGSLVSREGEMRETEPTMGAEDFSFVAALSDTLGCLAAECIRSEASKLARVYPRRRDRHHWCLTKRDGDNDDDRYRGLLLVKIPKAASSTSAGIVLRLAHRMNCAQYQWMHRPAVEYKADKVHPVNSFLFTSIRDPGQRAVSSIFFHVLSRDAHLEPTDHTLLHYLQHSTSSHYGAQSDGQGGFQLRYASFHDIPKQSAWMAADPTTVINPELVASNVRQALQGYGFVLVTERMDESLVAMALLLGIDVGDVLVTASKVAGSTYHLVKPAGKDLECLPTLKVCLRHRKWESGRVALTWLSKGEIHPTRFVLTIRWLIFFLEFCVSSHPNIFRFR